MNSQKIEDIVRQMLMEFGENPDREGLVQTPRRVARAWADLVSGYAQDPVATVRSALFGSDSNHMVIVKDIEIYSLCEHHLLPFYGRCHIGYIPRGQVVGVSKLARVADIYARRLQIQERLTHQIARLLMDHLDPEGVGVVIEAKHLCMMMRGVGKQSSSMMTSAMLGSFHNSAATRDEFLTLIGRREMG